MRHLHTFDTRYPRISNRERIRVEIEFMVHNCVISAQLVDFIEID